MDDSNIVFPVPPPEVDIQGTLPIKRTQEQANIATPPAKRQALSHKKSLLSGYAIQQIAPIGKVDRTFFYEKFIFHKQDQTKEGEQVIEIKPGMVIGLWQFGKVPFVVKALTNNQGTSVIWKSIVKKIDGDADKIIKTCDEATSQPEPENVPNDEFSVQVSEIWYIYSDLNYNYNPSDILREKKESLESRKRRNRKKFVNSNENTNDVNSTENTKSSTPTETNNPTNDKNMDENTDTVDSNSNDDNASDEDTSSNTEDNTSNNTSNLIQNTTTTGTNLIPQNPELNKETNIFLNQNVSEIQGSSLQFPIPTVTQQQLTNPINPYVSPQAITTPPKSTAANTVQSPSISTPSKDAPVTPTKSQLPTITPQYAYSVSFTPPPNTTTTTRLGSANQSPLAAFESILENHTKAINQLQAAVLENKVTVAGLLEENKKATEKLIATVSESIELFQRHSKKT